MRFGGNRYWQYGARALIVACASLGVFAGSASAGGLGAGGCAVGRECTLQYAAPAAGFSGCLPETLARGGAGGFTAERRKWSRRRLRGNGQGRFRTRGRHGAATRSPRTAATTPSCTARKQR